MVMRKTEAELLLDGTIAEAVEAYAKDASQQERCSVFIVDDGCELMQTLVPEEADANKRDYIKRCLNRYADRVCAVRRYERQIEKKLLDRDDQRYITARKNRALAYDLLLEAVVG